MDDFPPLYVKYYGHGVKRVYMPHFYGGGDYSPDEVPDGQGVVRWFSRSMLSEAEKAEKCLHDAFRRAKKTVYDLTVCNKWEHFFTLTFKDDRTDVVGKYDLVRKVFGTLKRDFPGIGYLVVAEFHKGVEEDGNRAVHFHGLLSGLPKSEVGKRKKIQGRWVRAFKRFSCYGFTDISEVRDSVALAGYLVKYITKDMIRQGLNKSSYIVSRGLNRPKCVKYYMTVDSAIVLSERLERMRARRYTTFYGDNFEVYTQGAGLSYSSDIDDFRFFVDVLSDCVLLET